MCVNDLSVKLTVEMYPTPWIRSTSRIQDRCTDFHSPEDRQLQRIVTKIPKCFLGKKIPPKKRVLGIPDFFRARHTFGCCTGIEIPNWDTVFFLIKKVNDLWKYRGVIFPGETYPSVLRGHAHIPVMRSRFHQNFPLSSFPRLGPPPFVRGTPKRLFLSTQKDRCLLLKKHTVPNQTYVVEVLEDGT